MHQPSAMMCSAVASFLFFIFFDVSLAAEFTPTVRKTTFTRIPSLQFMGTSCGAACTDDPNCSGYTVNALDECVLIPKGVNVTDVCSVEEMACYSRDYSQTEPTGESTTAPAEPEPCVESTRSANDEVINVTFLNKTTVIVYDSFTDMLAQNPITSVDRPTYYPGIPDVIQDMYHMNIGGTQYVVMIYGDPNIDVDGMMLCYKYSGSKWVLTCSPRTVQAEHGLSVSTHLDAADYDKSASKLYLIRDNTVYELSVSGGPIFTYTLLQQFELTDASNPFPPTNGVPPQYIRAIWMWTSEVIAFTGKNVHHYDRSTETWVDHGLMHCG